MIPGYGRRAFPRPKSKDGDGWDCDPQDGMTLCDYFAGQALVGLLGNHHGEYPTEAGPDAERTDKAIAATAYEVAAEMIKERDRYLS